MTHRDRALTCGRFAIVNKARQAIMNMRTQITRCMTVRRWRTLAGAIAVILNMAIVVRAQTFHDRHVLFDNSPADGSYFQSEGMVTPPSKLEMVDYKLPVTRITS